jgi:hypothetical protein
MANAGLLRPVSPKPVDSERRSVDDDEQVDTDENTPEATDDE